MNINGHKLDKFTEGYLVCALWASEEDGDNGGIPSDKSLFDISDDCLKQAIADCAKFQEDNSADLELAQGFRPDDHLGHDFWFTRNHHGVGFWDRGMGDVGTRLTAACKAYKEINLYIGKDGKIYAE